MRLCHKLAGTATFLVVWIWAAFASAQSAAAAEALFNHGLADMEAGDYESACPAFAECQRIDPTPGTLFTWAECEAMAGKIAAASAHYAEYLRLFERMGGTQQQNHQERARIAKSKQEALRAEVPTLRLVLPPSAPSTVRITRDGEKLDASSLGIAVPVDPGEHRVTTQVPGGALVEQRITLARRDAKTLALEVRVARPNVEGSKAPSPVLPAPDARGGLRSTGFVAGGLGIAGLATGSIAGAFALSKKHLVEKECDASRCSAEGMAAVASGRTIGTVSTVGFAIGVVGLASGAILVFTSPDEKKPRRAKAELQAGVVGVGPSSVLVGLKGGF